MPLSSESTQPAWARWAAVVFDRPGAGLGPGSYDYVTTVTEAAGVLLIQGKKCADCDSITWL